MTLPTLRRALPGALLLAALGLPAGAQEATSPPEPVEASEVVATVNGEHVTLAELVAARGALPQQYQQLPDPALYDALREQAVTQTIVAQAAEAAALAEDPEVAEAIARARKEILAQAFIRQAIQQQVDDAAVAAAYEREFVEAEPVREIRARHILVDEEAVAQALKERLEAGETFAALAEEAGTDGTAQRGGDLGWFGPEQMVPAFSEAAFSAPLGEVVGPVQTDFGWHLIEVTEERTREVPPLDQVRGQIARRLAGEAVEATVADLREGAAIETPEGRPGMAGLRDDSLIAYP